MHMTPRRRAVLHSLGLACALLMGLAAWASPAAACSCMRRPAEEVMRAMPAIFEARILEVRTSTRWAATLDVVVEPTDIWKGAVPDRAVLRSSTSSAICGVFGQWPEVGQTLLARADRVDEDGAFLLFLCIFAADAASLPTLYGPGSTRRRLDAAVEAAPGSLAPVFDRARFRESWDPEGAAAAYAALARDHPELAAAHLGLGRTLRNTPRVAEAVPALRQAVALNPTDPEAPGLLAQARLRLGDGAVLDGMRDFRGLIMDRLDIAGRDQRGADFSDARFEDFRGREANLQRASFRNTMIRDADLRGADLRDADLTGIDAPGSRLDGAKLDGVRMDRASLNHTRSRGVSMRRIRGESASLAYAYLHDADFTGAHLGGASFRNTMLPGADLRGANLRGADLRGADLRGAHLAGASFVGASYDCRTQFPQGFEPGRRQMNAGACPAR